MVAADSRGRSIIRALRTLAMGILPAVFLVACEEPPKPEPIRPVRAIKVADAEAVNERWFPGRAAATQEANLAFDVSGTMIERVDVGDGVKAGDLLARLDPRDFENQLTRAKAERDRARAQRDRVRMAGQTGAVSRQDVTDAEARYNQAAATVSIKQKALDDSHIFAPFDGAVVATYAEKFEAVQPKEPILRLLDTARIEMTIDIPESGISSAHFVKDIRIRFDTLPGREFPAEIKEISNEASETTRTYPVTVIMDAPTDVEIQPGMAGEVTGRVELPTDMAATGYEVPLTAIFSREDQRSYVWVIDGASKIVSAREVQTGELTPRGVYLRSGVEPGDWIATAGVHFLREGQQVRVLESGEEPGS